MDRHRDDNRRALAASWLHWITAALILAMIPLGKYMSWLAVSADKAVLYRAHAVLGIVVLLISLWRAVITVRGPRPPAEPDWPAWLSLARRAVHLGLYAVMLLLAASGAATVALSGLGEVLISGDLARWPELAAVPPANAHHLLASVMPALLALHVLAALYHQLALHDRLVDRIVPKRP